MSSFFRLEIFLFSKLIMPKAKKAKVGARKAKSPEKDKPQKSPEKEKPPKKTKRNEETDQTSSEEEYPPSTSTAKNLKNKNRKVKTKPPSRRASTALRLIDFCFSEKAKIAYKAMQKEDGYDRALAATLEV